ncbi:MAG: transposase [Candidatus Omnitrophica bacterium]|nr:transposase [Candidatus Omnitrophota bacterium]
MSRIARVEALGYPHHVIQRGNRNQNVFFSDQDKETYLKILKINKDIFGFEIWSYCLMDNHVHLVVVPNKESGMIMGIAETHRMYTRMINFRYGWRGYLWQGRFKSFVMDENYLFETVRYIEMNPVKARVKRKAEEYNFSSAKAHLTGSFDEILDDFYLLRKIKNWQQYLNLGVSEDAILKMKESELTGRPLGSDDFLKNLGTFLGREFIKRKPGPKIK